MRDHTGSEAQTEPPPALHLDRSPDPVSEDDLLLKALRAQIEERTQMIPTVPHLFNELYSISSIDPLIASPLPTLGRSPPIARKKQQHHHYRPASVLALLLILLATSGALAFLGSDWPGTAWKGPVISGQTITLSLPREAGRTLSPLVNLHPPPTDQDPPDLDAIAQESAGGSAARGITVRPPPRKRRTPQPAHRSRERAPLKLPTETLSPSAESPTAGHEFDAIVDSVVGNVLNPSNETVLPPTPSRANVLAGLRGVSSQVERCGLGQQGRVTVDVTLDGRTGRISSSRVTGADSNTTHCVQRALNHARFGRFDDDSFRVRGFPFNLR